MKSRNALIALVALLAATVPLAGSEASDEALALTPLEPRAEAIDVSLPGPQPVELLYEEDVPAPAPNLSLPLNLPAYRPPVKAGKALFDANLILMLGLNVADYISTKQALKYPGLEETNPLMKPFVKDPTLFAAVKFGTTALSYWSMKAIFKKNKTVAWIMTTASNALLSYVVANNVRLIRAARAR